VLTGYLALRSLVVAPLPAQLIELAPQPGSVVLSDLGKLVLPIRLQVLAAPEDTLAWPGLGVVALVALMMWVVPSIHRPTAGFALGTVLLVLLVSLAGTRHVVLENRLYLAAAGMSLLFAELLRASLAAWPHRGRLLVAVCGAAVVALAGTSLGYSPSFGDRHRFAGSAIVGSPHSGVAVNLLRRSSGVGMPQPPRPTPR
jgi:hypothetical protein